MSEELRIEYVPLSEVAPAGKNPKRHDLEAIKASMRRFGYVVPVTRDDRTGKLVAGHGRREALEEMRRAGEEPPRRVRARGGEWHVPVLRGVSFKTAEEAEAYLLADNRLGELGGWDEGMVGEMVRGLDPDLSAITGFDVSKFAPPAPPEAFTAYDEGIEVEHRCPKCGYEWSGKPA